VVSILSGVAAAPGITYLYLRRRLMPTIPALDFFFLGLFLGPVLEESVFRGCLLPVLTRTLGKAMSVLATAVLFAAFHAPSDITHWMWFTTTGLAYGWLFGFSNDHGSRLDACGLQFDSVPYCQILILDQLRPVARSPYVRNQD